MPWVTCNEDVSMHICSGLLPLLLCCGVLQHLVTNIQHQPASIANIQIVIYTKNSFTSGIVAHSSRSNMLPHSLFLLFFCVSVSVSSNSFSVIGFFFLIVLLLRMDSVSVELCGFNAAHSKCSYKSQNHNWNTPFFDQLRKPAQHWKHSINLAPTHFSLGFFVLLLLLRSTFRSSPRCYLFCDACICEWDTMRAKIWIR